MFSWKFAFVSFSRTSKTFLARHFQNLVGGPEFYGINGFKVLKWSTSDRRQCIVYNFDNISPYNEIKCGVPQDSILDLVLFLIHINDLFKASSNLTPVIFADDTNLFLSGKKIETLFQSMNRDLEMAKNFGLKQINSHEKLQKLNFIYAIP